MTSRNAAALLLSLSCSLLPGCGTKGGTNRFVLDLDPTLRAQTTASVRVGSVGMENWGAAHLVAVKVYEWGRFDATDLGNIDNSLRDTLAVNAPGSAGRPNGVELHLVVRGYVLATSNMAGAILASVTWAAVDAEGKLLHQEQFYAADSVMIVGTIGLLKDSVHQAVVRRVASRALALASGQPLPSRFPKTFDRFEDAVSTVPERMISRGDPQILAMARPAMVIHPTAAIAAGIVGAWRPRGMETVEWRLSQKSAEFDWAGYLARLREMQ